MGLAWTSLGGNALYIEAAVVEKGEGKGGLRTTGRAPGPISPASAEPNPLVPNPRSADVFMLVTGSSSALLSPRAHMRCPH